MELPTELYVVLYGMANDVKTTKSLRTVSHASLKASEIYHKILLQTPLSIGFDGYGWLVFMTEGKKDTELQQELKEQFFDRRMYGNLLTLSDFEWEQFTSLKMTAKELFSIRKADRTCARCYPTEEI